MTVTRQYRSKVMASIHETAEGLHAVGVMDKQTVRKFRVTHDRGEQGGGGFIAAPTAVSAGTAAGTRFTPGVDPQA